jgi:formate hydrogenlyase subunit 6/NADH:ubiquinone oxidoreductase subunit I
VGYAAPTIDESKCIACGKCSRRCPVFQLVDTPVKEMALA